MRRVAAGIGLAAVAIVVLGLLWVAPRVGVPTEFWFSPIETVTVDGRELRVVRVDYAQGLRGVRSLGNLDGALFALDQVAPTDAGMGMDDTLMPLDVVFFDPDGRFIVRHTMPVCHSTDCSVFFSNRPWQFAIEAPAESLAWMPATAALSQ